MFFYHSAQKESKHEMYSEKINDNSSSYSIPGITKITQGFVDRSAFNESSPGSRKDDLKSSYYPKLSAANNGSVISDIQSMLNMQPQMQQQSYSSEGYNNMDIVSKGMQQRIDQESMKRDYVSKNSIMNATAYNSASKKNGNMYLMPGVPLPSTPSQSNYHHDKNRSTQGKATVHDQKIGSSYMTNQEYYGGYSKPSGNELQRVVSDTSGEKKDHLKNDHATGGYNNDERNDFIARGMMDDASSCDATTPSYANIDSTNKGTSTPPRSGSEAARLDYNDDNAAARMLRFLQVHSPSQNSIAELLDDPVVSIIEDESDNQRRSTFLLTESSESSSSSALYELKEQNQTMIATKSHKEINKKSTAISGKILENSDENNKTLKSPAQKNNEPILPDLRHVLPPWLKLVGNGSKVVELEDRDELFIPDEEKQDAEGNNSAILSQDRNDAIRLRSRSTIDPSFDALFVAMAQMVPCRLNADDQNSAITSYKNHEIGFPGLSCRHCGGRPGSGRYFPNSVRSLSQTTTAHNMIKHFVNASNVVPDDEYYRDDGDVGLDEEGYENEERENNNDAEDRNGSQKKLGGKAQRIGGRHCTKCPYSVWLWLNEFQRRLKECKSVEAINEVDYLPQDNGQRVKYGARKIFYNRVWQRMTTQTDATAFKDDERDDIDDRGDFESGGHPSINTHSRSSLNLGDKNHPMIAVKKKKQSLRSKVGNTKVMAATTKSSENHTNDPRTKKRKNEITFLDLTFGANTSSGDNNLEHKQQKQRRS